MLTAALWIVGVVAAISVLAYLLWGYIGPLMRDSETLFVGRVTAFLGALGTVIAQTDMGPVLTSLGLGKYTPIVLFVLGIAIEFARRNRATDL